MEDCSIVRVQQLQMLYRRRCCMSASRCMFGSLSKCSRRSRQDDKLGTTVKCQTATDEWASQSWSQCLLYHLILRHVNPCYEHITDLQLHYCRQAGLSSLCRQSLEQSPCTSHLSTGECPDVKNYNWRFNLVWHRMLYSCTHMTTVGVKGLTTRTTRKKTMKVNSVNHKYSYAMV